MSLWTWLIGWFRPAPGPPPPVPVPALPTAAADLLPLHNAERARAGLAPFRWDNRLATAAQGHAAVMARRRTLAHMGIGDGDPWTRMNAAGYAYSVASENAAEGQRTSAEVMAGWMSDPPHAANVLGPYRDMGAGIAADANGVLYWCVDFASPLG